MAIKFLKDSPISKDAPGFFDFYHKNVAPALKTIIENDTCVHTVGLFGRWGSGKSTIIKLLKEAGVNDAQVIEFDCWKYEKDSLRRQLLIQIAKDLGLSNKELSELEKDFYFSVSEKIAERLHISWAHLQKVAIYAVPFAVPILLLSWLIYPDLKLQWKGFLGTSLSLIVALSFLIDKFLTDDFKKIIMVSPVTATKNQMDSPELFEKTFINLIKKAKNKNKLVIVIDNLDRVDAKIATEILSTLKTFLEINDSKLDGKKIVFLVPCDFEAVKNAAPSPELADEFLRKIFNVVIWTPEFIDSDLQKYTKSLLEEAESTALLSGDDRLISVINFAFSNNPREIKQFINNLLASLTIASHTEVKGIIEANISYLAKVLVLRQKYPAAYQRLKDKWYDPENIIETEDSIKMKGFREFMLNTSPVFVNDAEPFIYLKKPLTPSGITDPEKIKLTLINESVEECVLLINQENLSDALEYITDLLFKYRTQVPVLVKVFNTQLQVISRLNTTINHNRYLNASLEVIESSLWASFETFPTDLIFNVILGNSNTQKTVWWKSVLERYAVSLNSDILKEGKNIPLLKSIVGGFARHPDMLNEAQFLQIKKSIQENFATITEIVELFNSDELQDKFLTQESLMKFITSLDRKNFNERKSLILALHHAISAYSLEEKLVIRLADVLKEETVESPSYREEKGQLIADLENILKTFGIYSLMPTDNENWIAFIDRILEASRAIEGWDNRWIFIPILRQLKSTDLKNQEIKDMTRSFFQDASAEKIEHLLGTWSKEVVQEFINENLEVFTARIKDEKLLRLIYSRALEQSQIQIIKQVVSELGAGCVAFIKEIKGSLSNKSEVINLLFEKGSTIPFGEAVLIYHELIPELVNKNSPVEVKTLISEKAIAFLKSDTPADQDVGKTFLEIELFSKEAKREVIKELLAWLRAPGKVVTHVHAIALGLIASLFEILQVTLQNDFVYTLFDMVRPERDHDTIKTGLGILEKLKLAYKDYEKDFNDLLERLSGWSDSEDKRLVIDSLKSFQKDLAKKLEYIEKTKESPSEIS